MKESLAAPETSAMSNCDAGADTSQPDLFFDIQALHSFTLSREQVSQMVSAVTEGFSRERIALEMTELGCATSKAMIDAWASPAHTGHNLPFYLAGPLESVCRSTILTDWQVALRGGSARYGADALRREIAEEMAALDYKRTEFTQRINALKKQLGNT